MTFSSQHHSFDIALASRYGTDCAILIHHFQHWVRLNRYAGRNIKEEHCWTYQSRKEIQAHFPYWTFDEVRRICEKLVGYGILIKNNFNKSKVDKTLWYAFADEKAFGVDEESSKMFYERQNCPSKGKSAFPEGKSATPIPDNKPYSKATDREEKKEKKSAAPPPSAIASDLCKFFIEKIKERNPNFKFSKVNEWAHEFDLMLEHDKRPVDEIKALIGWIHTHSFWKANCVAPSSLRKHYDKMVMQRQSQNELQQIEDNRHYVLAIKKNFPERLKDLTISPKYAMNVKTCKEVPFSLPEDSFRAAFLNMFGGRYEPNRPAGNPASEMESDPSD